MTDDVLQAVQDEGLPGTEQVLFPKKMSGAIWTIPLSQKGGLDDSSEAFSSSAD